MKKKKEKQFEFLLQLYVINFLEQKGIKSERMVFGEMITQIMDDSDLNPSFSIYLIMQIQGLLYNDGEAESLRTELLLLNN